MAKKSGFPAGGCTMPHLDLAAYLIDLIGTLSFAVAGAMVAADRRMDLFGVLSMGIVTAMGGGVMRDCLLGHFPARNFYSYDYICFALAASLIVFIMVRALHEAYARNRKLVESVNSVFDAIGLASFTVTGVQIAMDCGHTENGIFCVFLGMMTGVGGGILRDVMCCVVPQVFTRHIYAVASIAGGVLYYACVRSGATEVGTVLAMAFIFTLRMLARTYRWNLPRIPFSAEENGLDDD
jgi:uncharacterized membrane protein YeiH